MMGWYAALAVVRIQAWIAATPDLSHLRGASLALEAETSVATITGLFNDESAGDVTVVDGPSSVSGVVVIEGDTEDAVRRALLDLSVKVSTRLPGVQWHGWWQQADTYVEAYDAAHHDARRVLDVLPEVPDNGIVESCPTCRREPSGSRTHTDQGDRVSDGRDCTVRKRADRQGRQGRGAVAPGHAPADFTELAREGGRSAAPHRVVGRKESRSHLATVVADGNGMGGLFAQLARTPGAAELHARASELLNDRMEIATRTAARAAGAADTATAASLRHYTGGDDLMASVAAPHAWAYAIALAKEFEKLREELIGCLGRDAATLVAEDRDLLQAEIERVSLGVGLCFAHASHPFDQTRVAAERAMRAAKTAQAGAASAIGWIDLTSDRPDRAFVVDLTAAVEDLGRQDGRPARDVFAVTPSGRARLAALLRDAADVAAAVRQWDRRRSPDDGPPLSSPPREMEALLSRARWWPVIATEEATS